MKTTLFKTTAQGPSGHLKCSLKAVGHGWEVSLSQGPTPLFVGNFVHAAEARDWFRLMQKEIAKFSKQYPVGQNFPMNWYQKFLGDYLYKAYYSFLDRIFAKHTRTFRSHFKKDFTQYRKLSRRWTPGEKHPALKKAA